MSTTVKMTILTALTAALVVVVFIAMWRAWHRRAAEQETMLPALATPPSAAELGDPIVTGRGLYVATTKAADHLDRVSARSLGFRAWGSIAVHPEGVVMERDGSDPVLIPRENLDGAGLEDYTVDKGVEHGGLTAVDWIWGDLELTTFWRMRRAEDGPAIVEAVRAIAPPRSAARRAGELMF